MRSFTTLGLLLLLAACDSPTVEAERLLRALEVSPVTYADLSNLPADKLADNSATSFTIGPGSPVLEIGDSGKSYVRAFELPPGTQNMRLVVRSYLNVGLTDESRAFYPILTLLDAERRPIATTTWSDAPFKTTSSLSESNEPNRLEYSGILSGERRAKARFVVISTNLRAAQLSGLEAPFAPYRIAATTYIPIFIPSGGPRKPILPPRWSVAGRLKIIVGTPPL